jgi:tetratricopeptide (TPR) repeat protein
VNSEEKTLYVKLAYQYYQNKEYKRAYELYAKLAEADPEDFNVFNMLGDIYLKAGIKNKAADAYADTMAILERKGQNLKLIKLAKKVIKNIPDDPRIKTKLKTALRNMMRDAERKTMNHEYLEAREMLESMLDFSSEELPVKAKMQELEAEESKHMQREKQLSDRKAESMGGSSQNELIEKFERMAQNYMNNDDYDGAVETYITALKLAPGNNEIREKLHRVYVTIAQKSAGERVWDKIDMNPRDRIEDAKRKAAEERRTQILKEEEDRARLLMDEEERIQQEYELMEADIIQKAAQELKIKLDEAQKKEKLKEEEIQRIMKEQEENKRELLEKIKKEPIEKWKKQKEAIQNSAAAPGPAAVPDFAKAPPDKPEFIPKPAAVPQPPRQPVKIELPSMPPPQARKPASLMDTLKKTYESPKIGEGKFLPETQRGSPTVFPKVVIRGAPGADPSAADKAHEDMPKEEKKDDIVDDIGEVEHKIIKDDIVVNGDTLDSLITTAYIYINQRMFKEALHIYNKITEKYPANQEAKQLVIEITKRQGT